MTKISAMIILLAGFLTVSFLVNMSGARAEDQIINNDNQVLKDEGYGNDDVEYNNSEQEEASGTQNEAVGNIDEGTSVPQENSLNNVQ